jgi:hypothetical protein
MTATVKRFNEVVPRMEMDIDFHVASAPGFNEGKPFVLFVRCPRCSRPIDTKLGIAVLGMTHYAFRGEVDYALDIGCALAISNGEPDRGVGLAVLGAVASINAARGPGTVPPEVVVIDRKSALALETGVTR